jgi:hypothetical protein
MGASSTSDCSQRRLCTLGSLTGHYKAEHRPEREVQYTCARGVMIGGCDISSRCINLEKYAVHLPCLPSLIILNLCPISS